MTRKLQHFRFDPKVDELLKLLVETAREQGLKTTKTQILERSFVNQVRMGIEDIFGVKSHG